KRVDLREAAEQAQMQLAHVIVENNATITVGALPFASGHLSHLVLLFQNLFGNAIKYRSQAPPVIEVTAEKTFRGAVIRVKDNGVGIPLKYHDQVFGLFKRLHGREIAGTGMGLAICKKIVESMRGRIWVESTLGQGSTFCFSLRDSK